MGNHLLHIFPSLEIGGVQRRFAAIANALGQECQHSLLAMDGNYDALGLLSADLSIDKLPQVQGSTVFSRLFQYRRAVQDLNPDCLLTYNWGTIEWALAARSLPNRHIHLVDGFGLEEASHQLRRRVWARRVVLRGNTEIIVPSSILFQMTQREWQLPESAVHLIPNGVDLNRFGLTPGAHRASTLGLDEDSLIVGTVAALRPEKNIERLINAFTKSDLPPQAHLVIVGDGPEREDLEEVSRGSSFSERVHFVGTTDQPERYLKCFDVFAMSSDTEQMPISLVEAMAVGLPIASTDVGDIRQMTCEDNQKLIVGKSTYDLSIQIRKLCSDLSLRQSLGAANGAKARSYYSLEEMVAAHRHRYYGNC